MGISCTVAIFEAFMTKLQVEALSVVTSCGDV